ncbi:hypothetical protein BJ138DRAFT_205959 [Hygrophoropsis aurantiaca]|uniref:Uncharacterized protein n=1 Tax=Hygrophoropsis aurantiaca TaxID=72124 RepID=A0ACB7ZPW8_9AGAM|nr:hypothetical protein BJ138DRAFT_205959 [Hygrophoropsis aurantiaca]
MPTPPEELRASLEAHNATFEALLRLIPAKYYLSAENINSVRLSSFTLSLYSLHSSHVLVCTHLNRNSCCVLIEIHTATLIETHIGIQSKLAT